MIKNVSITGAIHDGVSFLTKLILSQENFENPKYLLKNFYNCKVVLIFLNSKPERRE